MELALNLGWVLLTVWMFCLWARFAPRAGHQRWAQCAALAVTILILLPAISVTDDLMAAQNPAEIVTSVRRDHDDSLFPHSIVPLIAVPEPLFAGISLAFTVQIVSGHTPPSFTKAFALSSVQNRPPPSA